MSFLRNALATLATLTLLACTGQTERIRLPAVERPAVAPPAPAPAAPAERPADTILFRDVRIFTGHDESPPGSFHVMVRGNLIERISLEPIIPETGTTVIEGGGHTLMPGLIDMHWHTMFVAPTIAMSMTADPGYLNILAAAEAHETLMRGFTTVRDLGGASFGVKRAIDEGVTLGPRIYPSGAMISITSGHGDFRQPWELPRTIGAPLSRPERMGDAMIADSPDEVRVRAREQLMQGASQIKLTAGGGVSSPHSPLDVVAFTEAELRAAVEAADNWGTYVVVHAYTPAAIQRSIAAGAKCIEHGSLMDEATAKMIAGKGIWLSMQPFASEMADAFPQGSTEWIKAHEILDGNDHAYQLAKEHGIKTAFGTDVLFSHELARQQGSLLVSLTRWYTPVEALTMATSTNAELLALSGKRNPYPGRLGVVEEGALADLLLVHGDPVANIELIADPANNFVVIMKDGHIFKNTIAGRPQSRL